MLTRHSSLSRSSGSMNSTTRSSNLLHELKLLGAKPKSCLFACGGTTTLNKNIHLRYTKNANDPDAVSSIQFPTDPDNGNTKMAHLIAACDQATFGKGDELVLDLNYRAAFSLPFEDRWTTSLDLAETDILSQLKSVLAPDVVKVRARPYKLNIYKEGGFFKAHQDTPRGSDMFGTLVVCLPSAFVGGEFEVEHKRAKEVFAWGGEGGECAGSSASGTSSSSGSTVQWCAFYSDCTHQVLEVKRGYRVTLTYLLESDSRETRLPLSVSASPFVVKLEELIKRMKAMDSKGYLGFALENDYKVEELSSDPVLKGFDRFLECALKSLGFKPIVVPVFLVAAKTSKSKGASEGNENSSHVDCDEDEWFSFDRRLYSNGITAQAAETCENYLSSWSGFLYPDSGYMIGYGDIESDCLGADNIGVVRWIVRPNDMELARPVARGDSSHVAMVNYYAAAAFLVEL